MKNTLDDAGDPCEALDIFPWTTLHTPGQIVKVFFGQAWIARGVNNEHGSRSAQARANLKDDFLAKAASRKIKMNQRPAVLDDLAQHRVDLFDVNRVVWIVDVGNLHDIVPGQT